MYANTTNSINFQKNIYCLVLHFKVTTIYLFLPCDNILVSGVDEIEYMRQIFRVALQCKTEGVSLIVNTNFVVV